jgi:hypothetical protein
LEVPVHTWGSVMFKVEEDWLFSGDFLFSSGVGRFFEGGAKHFCESVERSVRLLKDDVQMFPGHEYTCSNLEFALRVDPSDEEMRSRLAWAQAQREQSLPTIPSTLADERRFNLFLRAASGTDSKLGERVRSIVQAAGSIPVAAGSDRDVKETSSVTDVNPADPVDVVRALRAMKDRGLPSSTAKV